MGSNCSLKSAHYSDVIMSAMASQITGVPIAYSTVWSGTDQRKHQSTASLAFVRGIHLWPVNSPHKGPVTRKMFPFDDVIISWVKSRYRRLMANSHTASFHIHMCTNLTDMHIAGLKNAYRYWGWTPGVGGPDPPVLPYTTRTQHPNQPTALTLP